MRVMHFRIALALFVSSVFAIWGTGGTVTYGFDVTVR
jgi:hypothetical protein